MRYFLAICFLMLALSPALATKETPLPDVSVVESYLNGLTTMKSRFIQTAGNGQQITGIFMLNRPGRLRFDYDDPVKDFIVADGTFIFYYDSELKQQNSTLISQSLADFFLRKDLKMSGDVSVAGMERVDGLLEVTLTQSKDPLAGSLTLIFSESPLQLKKWRVVDTQGLTTQVELYETQLGIPLKKSLFHYYDPEKKKAIINK